MKSMKPPSRLRTTHLVLLLAAGAAVALFLRLVADLPPPTALQGRAAVSTTKILDRHGRLLFEVLDTRSGRRTLIRLADLPPHVIDAVLAVEDSGFRRHPGIDA